MAKINSISRNHCVVERKRITHRALIWDYVCKECEGKLEVAHDQNGGGHLEHVIICSKCGIIDDVKHISCIRKEQVAAVEVARGLPPELAAVFERPSTMSDEDLKAAKEALF